LFRPVKQSICCVTVKLPRRNGEVILSSHNDVNKLLAHLKTTRLKTKKCTTISANSLQKKLR
jgi:hypothetical protein